VGVEQEVQLGVAGLQNSQNMTVYAWGALQGAQPPRLGACQGAQLPGLGACQGAQQPLVAGWHTQQGAVPPLLAE